MIDFKEKVIELISNEVDFLSKDDISNTVEIPPSHEMGDYAFPVFRLSKTFKKAPNLISEDLVSKIGDSEYFEKIENVGPYINFFIDDSRLVGTVMDEIKNKGDKYGSSKLGKDKTVIVEFSSPNIAKPFHIGHIRTTVIG